MSAPASNNAARSNNTGRALPTPPIDKKVPTPQNTGLALLVPKESPRSSPERPQLKSNVQEFAGDVRPVSTGGFESQSSPPKNPPPPIPRRAIVPTSGNTAPEQLPPRSSNADSEGIDSPYGIHPETPIGATFRTKVERRLTTSPSGKRPAFLKLDRLESKEQKNSSPQFLPTYLLSPRIARPLDENCVTNYDEELDKLDADLKIEAYEIPARNQSRLNSPEKSSARPQLQRTSHVRQLSAAYRTKRENVISQAATQSDPSDARSGSENSDTKNN